MKPHLIPLLALALSPLCPAAPPAEQPAPDTGQELPGIYALTARAQDGSEVPLSRYRGQVLLIVNTATHCGFTPQYAELQRLYAAKHAAGLEILDFPCNQFGAQAPGSDEEINAVCTARFGTGFPRFAKVEVNGPGAAPLFRYLTTHTTFAGFGSGPMARRMEELAARQDPHFRDNGNIKWNFTKFLIDRRGRIVARFEPTADFATIYTAIEQAL